MTDEIRALPVTVEELDNLLDKMTSLRGEIEELDDKSTEKNKEMARLKGVVAGYLKELGRDSFVGKSGYKVYEKKRWTFSMPKDDLAKAKLFAYLKDKGVYEKYATVHAQSLNSYCKAEWDAAKARGEGMDFEVPGVGQPTLYEDVIFEKPRGKAAE